MKISAGLAIVYQYKEILLVHPTNSRWYGTFSIPKGMRNENDQNILQTAIRETEEEIGIKFDENDINPTPFKIEYKDKNNKITKNVYYFYVFINSKAILKNIKLQEEEVDFADFYNKIDVEKRIFIKLLSILDILEK